jgi:hypothetical protein
LKHLYQPTHKAFTVVDVPPLPFLMVDGQGDPNTTPEFQEAMQALYGMAYTLKFASKGQMGIDFTVMAVEGLWWTGDRAELDLADKSYWQWTAMIVLPDAITSEMVEAARAALARKKDVPALSRLRFEIYHEGLSVQIMYYGAYAGEGPTIARMHQFIRDNDYAFNGKHHEIYLGDPRRTAPEKLRTVLRQPVRRIE